MTDLLPEERAALVQALENGGRVEPTWRRHGGSFVSGLYFQKEGTDEWYLTQAGHIVATLLRDNEAGRRLERAKEKLAEWKTEAGSAEASLAWFPDERWHARMSWSRTVTGPVQVSYVRDPDPLTAVIAASQQTPWKLEE